MNLATVGLEWSIRGSGANLIVLSSQQDDRSSCVFVCLFVLHQSRAENEKSRLESVLYDAQICAV